MQVLGTTIQWRYHSTAHEIEPDPGDFHTDNADGELATVLHVSKTNSQNTNVELLVSELLSQGYNRIYLSQDSDPSQAHLYAIDSYVETTSGFEISVTLPQQRTLCSWSRRRTARVSYFSGVPWISRAV